MGRGHRDLAQNLWAGDWGLQSGHALEPTPRLSALLRAPPPWLSRRRCSNILRGGKVTACQLGHLPMP